MVVQPGKDAVLPGLTHIGANDRHAADAFLDATRQVGQTGLDVERAFHELAAHRSDYQKHEGIRRDRQQGQDRVHGQHGRHGVHVIQRGVQDVNDTQAEQQTHRGYVVDQARHQVADGLALVIAQRQGLQMRKQLVTQLMLDIPPHVEDQKARKGTDNPLEQGNPDNQQHRRRNLTDRPAVLDPFDRLLEQPRDGHGQGRRHHQTGDATHIPIAVLINIAPQTLHAFRSA